MKKYIVIILFFLMAWVAFFMEEKEESAPTFDQEGSVVLPSIGAGEEGQILMLNQENEYKWVSLPYTWILTFNSESNSYEFKKIQGPAEVLLDDIPDEIATPTKEFEANLTISPSLSNSYTLAITEDGQIEINGKPVKEMSHPEIKEILKEIAQLLGQQVKNDELIRIYNGQTEYLLGELEKCQKQIK